MSLTLYDHPYSSVPTPVDVSHIVTYSCRHLAQWRSFREAIQITPEFWNVVRHELYEWSVVVLSVLAGNKMTENLTEKEVQQETQEDAFSTIHCKVSERRLHFARHSLRNLRRL
jgi:hypothetical protein